jgi:hypothetical protein
MLDLIEFLELSKALEIDRHEVLDEVIEAG